MTRYTVNNYKSVDCYAPYICEMAFDGADQEWYQGGIIRDWNDASGHYPTDPKYGYTTDAIRAAVNVEVESVIANLKSAGHIIMWS